MRLVIGTIGTPVLYDTPNNAYSVVTGDFNNDGKLDLAVTLDNNGNAGLISVMLG
ncbi:MAG: FG-GAP repeat protein [Terriglobales bacterium]